MIKFFRKIRQNQLNENKFSKYMLYAFGEIALVVIGILIALQVNLLNEEQKQKKKEQSILGNFEKSLETDLRNLEFSIDLNNRVDSSISILLDHFEQNKDYNDSLKFHFGNTTFTPALRINLSVFETLKSNNLSLISNNKLREDIIDFYNYYITEVQNSNERYADITQYVSLNLYDTRFRSFWYSNYKEWSKNRVKIKPEMIPLDFNSLKNDTEYLYFLRSLPNRRNILVRDHINVLSLQIEQLIFDIKSELAK